MWRSIKVYVLKGMGLKLWWQMTHKNIILGSWEWFTSKDSNIMLLVIVPQSGTIIAVSYRDSQLLPMDKKIIPLLIITH